MMYKIIECPVNSGQKIQGTELGPKFLNYFGIKNIDLDVVSIKEPIFDKNQTSSYDEKIHKPEEVLSWTRSILEHGLKAFSQNTMPVFLGGDHSIAMGSVLSASTNAKSLGKPLYVLWIDAHSDINSLQSSESGNMHGMPLNYLTGKSDFPGFPEVISVDDKNIMMMGIRSVDEEEEKIIQNSSITFCDMDSVNDGSAFEDLNRFLNNVKSNDGILHVSFDFDFLDPSLFPGVGTDVEGGANLKHLEKIMEMIIENGHLGSLDIVELNPLLDSKNTSIKTIKNIRSLVKKLGKKYYGRNRRYIYEDTKKTIFT